MDLTALRSALLTWYRAHARMLVWRAPPGAGARPDPYRVWLSEVMLQQTTTAHATPYFEAFTQRWPTVADLAAAQDADVMAAWAGLGYYARARNLLACARAVADDHGGVFPQIEAELLKLPGVGAYTAAAVAAIAFGQPANVVDGNVERVMARLFAVQAPLPAARPELKRLAASLVADEGPAANADWPQALMDLGATVCRPKSPECSDCPIRVWCAGHATGAPERYPLKSPKAARPRRFGTAWVLRDAQGRVALVHRPPQGLLGGMLALPTDDWATTAPTSSPPASGLEWRQAGAVDHVFTHFPLTLAVQSARASSGSSSDFIWMTVDEALKALPTVFKKALVRGVG